MDGLSCKWGLKKFCFCFVWAEERPAERWCPGLADCRGQPGTADSQELSKEKGEKEF